MRNLTKKEFRCISIMIFGLYFGAGNLIFPPILGKESGSNAFISLIFFSITAIVFPILGVIVVSKFNGINKLSNMVDSSFTLIFTTAMYLTIGPYLSIPRNASTSFEITIAPYITNLDNVIYYRLMYTIVFFSLVYYLSMKPKKIVTTLGRILTPILLLLILLMFLGVIFKPFNMVAPVGDYISAPAIKGFIEGYNTADALAGLNFGIIIAFAIKSLGVTNEKDVTKITIKAGIVAGIILFIVYFMLTYIGLATASHFPDTKTGADILVNVVKMNYGMLGALILGTIFIIACLSVSVGLITSISQYFNQNYPKVSYRAWVITYILISFILANFGLVNILKISIPILLSIYPVSLVLILLGLFSEYFDNSKLVFRLCVYTTLIFSIGMVLNKYIGNILDPVFINLPFYSLNLGWLVPAIIAFIFSITLQKGKKIWIK
ncbi:branched-chain amino acid transport system II carrier protein [Streptobacillus moniliformis]|uniref:branched-chain amino acid transport system II carrier protein n=1 Tax=Streptobacillus moniliformis TaxID=34105 RepID=UPI0007E4588E|nr:branched-chain amino acid transport system II carrier protein [Streptobacillus moniliformis]